MILIITFIVCLVGGIFPLINADLYVIGAAPLASGAQLAALIGTATIGQIAGKTFIYVAGVRATSGVRLPMAGRWCQRLEKFHGTVVFLSALAGIPPFFAVAFASGVMRGSFKRFVIAATSGRLIHITLLATGASALFGGLV